MRLVFIIFVFFISNSAQAGYLRVESHREGRQYTLKNNGDETARRVCPLILVGNWSEELPAVDLTPGAEHAWQLPEDKIQKKLSETHDGRRGHFPVPVYIRYQDLNGYAFSAPEVQTFESPGLTLEEQKELAVAPLVATLTVETLPEQEFRIRYALDNQSTEPLVIAAKLWISEELRLLSGPVPLTLQPKSKLEGFFQIKNEKALAGSYYNLFATFEFRAADDTKSKPGLINFISASGGVQITVGNSATSSFFHINNWMIALTIFLLGWIALCVFRYRVLFRDSPRP